MSKTKPVIQVKLTLSAPASVKDIKKHVRAILEGCYVYQDPEDAGKDARIIKARVRSVDFD